MPEDEPAPPPPSARLVSLDAYRGLVMTLMLAEVMHLEGAAEKAPHNAVLRFFAHHQTHVEWVGCTLHDLIQPSFSFLVGAALPFSLASRRARGQTTRQTARHALGRAVALVLLGIFLRSIGREQTYFTFEDTLTQIGLGYFFLFLLGLRSAREQAAALGFILVGYWAAFALWPLPAPGFDPASVGVPPDWPHQLSGFAAHWNKNTNPAWAFDVWFLNLFPREERFAFNGGGYATLSFLPTLGTMVLGLLAGGVLKRGGAARDKVRTLALWGVACLATGALLGLLGLAPVVKRIWTPGWVVFSGGWCLLFLAAFYGVVDGAGKKKAVFPLVVVGMNSIAAYCLSWVFADFIKQAIARHFGPGTFRVFGEAYESVLLGGATLAVMWLVLFWMYRRKLFLRI